ncbi:MAG TPA: MaoC family dehydratase [Woeseiaceae bacterium]|nr:MaoC family dehydratase [Woeseiaceae bacterium]
MVRTERSIERTLTQRDFDSFAILSGDNNPIHVDPEFAAQSRFGRTVAHGMLLAAIFRGLIDEMLPGAQQVEQDLEFPAPTFADEAMRFTVRSERDLSGTARLTMTCSRVADDTVTCRGRTTVSCSPIPGRMRDMA